MPQIKFLLMLILISPILKAETLASDSKPLLSAKQKIQKMIPDFKPLPSEAFSKEVLKASKNSPTLVIGDFNGDEKNDISFYGYSAEKKTTYILVALSTKAEPRILILEKTKFKKLPKFTDWNTYVTLGVQKKFKGNKQDLLQIESQDSPNFNVEAYYYSHSKKKMQKYIRTLD